MFIRFLYSSKAQASCSCLIHGKSCVLLHNFPWLQKASIHEQNINIITHLNNLIMFFELTLTMFLKMEKMSNCVF